jgi:RNA polymerase sigma factor (TIGR02999 family)
VTVLLDRARQGDASATDELLPLVYEELRRLADQFLAGEQPGQTLQPTALVHEAYLRLVGPASASWENRAHFFGAAARAIRRILIERARARRRLRRGEGARPLALDDVVDPAAPEARLDLLELDEALERLAQIDAQKARIIELRFFGGLSTEETAEALGLSPSTITRDWRFARIWLHRELGREQE